jgi:ATP-dependent helicase/DNAse subunit B
VSLTIIKGPPNSGRTELVRERFEARLADDPVLVVPSTDDIFGWERRLTRARGAFLGGKVVHFKDLVDEILGDESTVRMFGGKSVIASPLRRRALVANSIRSCWPAIAGRLGDQPGLIDAALQTIDDFRANLVSVRDFDDPEKSELTGPMGAVYVEYLDQLEAAGLTDLPARTSLAFSRSLENWQGRPVFLAGFDDLTRQQLELIRRLSEQTEVLIAITHEQGNLAMAVTEALLGDLIENGGTVERETSRPDVSPDHTPLLVSLERAFLDPEEAGTLQPDDAVNLIEASGRRGEAEAIGAEIAWLVSNGVDPGEIAIAIDSPAANGRPILDLLTEYGIPVSLEAETKAPETVTGQAVINLLQAGSLSGDSHYFFSMLRGPLGLDQAAVDEAEFEAVRGGVEEASEARQIATKHGLDLPAWDLLQEGDTGAAVRNIALCSAGTLVGLRPETLPGSAVATETQMATAICRAVDELEELHGGSVTPPQVLEALMSGVIKTWAVPTARTVQISSPYSMRAKRAEYVFIASLQEKDLGGSEGSPLISREARAALRLPDMTDQEQQETYLFYSCLAVPTKGLWLSYRVADVHGKAEFPSPMVDEVKRLFVDRGSGLNLIRRSGSDIVFAPGQAPSVRELMLSSAASGRPSRHLTSLDAAASKVKAAEAIESSTATFRNLDSEAARAGLASRNMFSATALEAFIECPYRWFFERAVSPVRFGPDPEALAKGNLVHEVLAALYKGHPGALPTDSTIDDWLSEMKSLVGELAESCDLGGDSAPHLIQRRQVATELERFLRREARRENTVFMPVEFESRFGFENKEREEGEESRPPLEGDGWQLRGVIDRIDQDPEGNGVVIDYKSGPSSYKSLVDMKREGKIQLPLYLKALEELWGLKPAAGLYVPIFASKVKARGLIDSGSFESLKDIGLYPKDCSEDIQGEIQDAFERASVAAARILNGDIAHDPSECINHFAHAGVPDWSPDSASDNGSSGA